MRERIDVANTTSSASNAITLPPGFRDLSLSIEQFRPTLIRNLQRECNSQYKRKDGPWDDYGVLKDQVLCWGNCQKASELLQKHLKGCGIITEIMMNPKLPDDAIPYLAQRSVFPSPHFFLREPKSQVLIDSTWHQFVSLLVRPSPPQPLPADLHKKYFDPEILVCPYAELNRRCEQIAQSLITVGLMPFTHTIPMPSGPPVVESFRLRSHRPEGIPDLVNLFKTIWCSPNVKPVSPGETCGW